MKVKLITDPRDSFGDDHYPTGNGINPSLFPASINAALGHDGGGNLGTGLLLIPSIPALTAEAVQAKSAQSGSASVVAVTSGGVTINLLFDAPAMAAPARFLAGIQQAASLLTAAGFSKRQTTSSGLSRVRTK